MRNMNGLLNKSKHFWNKNASTILTSVGAVGVVATSVSTVKATTKASQLLEDAKTEKGECLTKTEKVKVALPSYIPVIALGAATIVCIFGANALNKRQQASMAGAYVFLDQTYKEYKSKVNSMYGDDAESQISEEIARNKYEQTGVPPNENGKELFYDEYSKRYFESTIEEVQRAEYRLNRDMVMRDYAYLNEWYEHIGLPPIDGGYSLGWSIGQCMDMYWQSWIDFTHSKVIMDDGRECHIIRIMEEPIIDFEEYC